MNTSTLSLSVALVAIACLVPVTGQAQQAGAPRALDRVVAIVNDDVITESELSQRVQSGQRQLRQQGISPPAGDVLAKQVLERMIVDRALIQTAIGSGIKIGRAHV